mgnify:CR=1 FL=1
MRNIKLTIEYDGTNYHGWQSQNNAFTIQAAIQAAIGRLTGEDCKLIGSGRTDTGVHALGQVANFKTDSKIPAERFSYALNSLLPPDIVIKKSEEAGMDFHSRYSARGKKYKYIIYNSPHPSALLRNRACHVARPLDCYSMSKAALCFAGTHDFLAFSASGRNVKNSVRTIARTSLNKRERCNCVSGSGEGGSACIYEFEIEGDGFLYNMVRIIAGTLIEVGLGRISAGSVPGIIVGRDRKMAGKTAPACGLYLVEVYY